MTARYAAMSFVGGGEFSFACPPCRAGSAPQGRTPGACAAGTAARSAAVLIRYG
jgi:hypothetical protein